ncbi:MAG: L-threonylcarbamoyladenylate synthase [Bacteroides sp.]|jgi:L-threonylcarbamoyladenylate synthase|nr:L-threonylcarbamoyladenylate synthase [Bacteroides sp.]
MEEEIKKIVEVLNLGGTILYPTDTIWGIGCDATNAKAAEKVYKLKGRGKERSLIVLVESVEMLREYVGDLPELAIDLIASITEPLTIIYSNARNLAKNVMAADHTIAVRIPRDAFCQDLLHAFGKPITSTSANRSGDPNPLSFSKIEKEILEGVDYVVKTNQNRVNRPKPSTMVRINKDGEIQILRN